MRHHSLNANLIALYQRSDSSARRWNLPSRKHCPKAIRCPSGLKTSAKKVANFPRRICHIYKKGTAGFPVRMVSLSNTSMTIFLRCKLISVQPAELSYSRERSLRDLTLTKMYLQWILDIKIWKIYQRIQNYPRDVYKMIHMHQFGQKQVKSLFTADKFRYIENPLHCYTYICTRPYTLRSAVQCTVFSVLYIRPCYMFPILR